LAVAFVDELATGIAPASAPELAHDLGIAPGLAAGVMITAFHALAIVVEAPLLAWADRGRVRVVSSISLFALGAATLLAALARGPVTLFVALALYGPASGCALAAAEGTLVESRPHDRERTMARWTLAGIVGDLAVPALLGLLAVVGLGWRTAMGTAGVVALVLAVTHACSRELDRPMATSEDDTEPDAPRPPLRDLVRSILETPALLGWSLAGVANGLLDEVLVAFAVVHLDLHAHASAAWRSAAVAAWTLGGVAGLVTLERHVSRANPLRILSVTGTIATASLAVFAWTRSPLVATLSLALVGASAATFHPLTKARAYASLPGRPGLVNAVASMFLPLDALAPLLIAAIATRSGSQAAVLTLLAAPIGIAAAAFRASRAAR
jgi:predicted MFS family arabinose efflux permease